MYTYEEVSMIGTLEPTTDNAKIVSGVTVDDILLVGYFRCLILHREVEVLWQQFLCCKHMCI
jgi:hypothetical protein